jgi:hypothetical protein
MPYIKQEYRDALDPAINELVHQVKLLEPITGDATKGNLNYTLTKIIMGVYGPKSEMRYAKIHDVEGLLGCVSKEFYRRVAEPYEDQKTIENGDVYE